MVTIKLSEETVNRSGIMQLNSPDGTTWQWDVGQGLLCSVADATCFLLTLYGFMLKTAKGS